MGRIHVLPEHVANKIAAGEVVERPASVVKELLENALDAGARRIRVQVEAGGKKLIQITDDGCGMVRDDALLAFERHATSKIRDADDLLNVATLGFRGEALPSIASVSRLRLETCAASQSAGTIIEIAGGRILKVEEAGLPAGTSVTVRDLFFNTPARKKFLKAESTELSHIASLVTHYALAHPDKHFELHSATNAILIAAPVASRSERIYQVFGKETLDQLLPIAAAVRLEHVGLPEPPPWRRGEDYERPEPGEVRVTGFVSRPEIQKLNRNSIFVFVNGRLIRDRLMQHALTDAYRNILPPMVFPVVLLFLELPAGEVDVNVHPSKTEVRFRQQGFVHDFVRDSVRAALMKTRPVPQFTTEIHAQPTASQALSPPITPHISTEDGFSLEPPPEPARNERLQFGEGIEIRANAAVSVLAGAETQGPSTRAQLASEPRASLGMTVSGECGGIIDAVHENGDGVSLASLAPLGQLRDSFILAVNGEGLWIIDQHVAHERVLFERVLRQRAAERVERQQLLMPLIIELTPSRQAIFSEISDELRRNGFEVEPFGSRTIAVKASPAGIDASDVERMLHELLDEVDRESQAINLERVRARIAASIACHAAIKVNTPLEKNKMEWLLKELARTECPMSCPHGRPVLLRYSVRDIQKAFKRI
ncbi:MAG TPA: DNA mismatch repair endonuclease MutL [Terriglobales bacterium]|nr:DNA mismatch repair endonuclease MutL [Terriglobales bacterium]